MSLTSKNDKSVNKNNVHESYQVRNAIIHICEMLSDEASESNVSNFKTLNEIYILAPTKIKGVFGNNLANTQIADIVISLLCKYNKDQIKSLSSQHILCLCLSCLWNATDCSENMGRKLVETKLFKESISESFRKCNLKSDMDKQFAYSMISIIHNIVRRQNLRDSFTNCNIEKQVVMLANTCDDQTIKVICLVVLLELVSTAELKEYSDLYLSIQEIIVCYLDGASNTDDFRCDGFSGKELLDMILSLSRIDYMKTYFQQSTTLNATFVRFLGKNYQIPSLIETIKKIYDEESIKTLVDVYKAKNKDHNDEILKGLWRIPFK